MESEGRGGSKGKRNKGKSLLRESKKKNKEEWAGLKRDTDSPTTREKRDHPRIPGWGETAGMKGRGITTATTIIDNMARVKRQKSGAEG